MADGTTHPPATPTPTAPALEPTAGQAWRDGVATFPVALGALAAWAGVVVADPSTAGRAAPPTLALAGAFVAWALVVLALPLVLRVLGHRVVTARRPAASRAVLAYGPVAVLVALLPVRAEVLPLVLGALAMTAPGVLTVVLDGSSVERGVTRVVGAVAMVPLAGVAGVLIGWLGALAASAVVAGVGRVVPGTDLHALVWPTAWVAGVFAGHLTTYVPLAAMGPASRRD